MTLSEAIERYWRTIFGLTESDDLWPDGVEVTAHGPKGSLAEYSGIWVVCKGAACRVSVPSELLARVKAATRDHRASEVADGVMLRRFFEPSPVTLGPSIHGYADLNTLKQVGVGNFGVEEVAVNDLSSLQAGCPEDEWNEGGFAGHDARFFALLDRNEIVAAANLTGWLAKFDDVGVIVHPHRRGNGFGAMIAGWAARVAIETDQFARYRVLNTNVSSVAIQRKLGFEPYCEQIAIRQERITPQ